MSFHLTHFFCALREITVTDLDTEMRALHREITNIVITTGTVPHRHPLGTSSVLDCYEIHEWPLIKTRCINCRTPWPCPTIELLDKHKESVKGGEAGG